ncbi:SANT/Myb_domain [Hexamita inflata]|uniref:SANT/Myb domain n=1 Tax=Hexamita inflata TaxID=28002 RepID=A0AA86PZM5_9EUKA|nr:SANT/Myb domain [Hexamita inflata]CAI9947061.1 SANT/Myb domain [Hexamita inflata]CAI9947062.1 SANT/Myb domain [Hexamita inflata]
MFESQLMRVHLLLQIDELQKQVNAVRAENAALNKKQPQAKPRLRDKWSEEEDALLVAQVKLLGTHRFRQIALNIPTKTENQVYFRLRYLRHVFEQDKEVQHNRTDLQCFQKQVNTK